MSPIYWDTSALLKLYVDEGHSRELMKLTDNPDATIWTSVTTGVEIRCALNQKRHLGNIEKSDIDGVMRQFARDCGNGRITEVPYDREITRWAHHVVEFAQSKRRPLMIGSLDAIHLACALSIKAPVIATTDARMREVAAMMELNLIPSHRAREVSAGPS